MEDFAALLSWTLRIFDLQFTLYGFTFSLWEVFLFSAAAGIAGKILGEVFFGD